MHLSHVRLDGVSVHERVSVGDARVAGHHAERARLAGSVHTEQPEALALAHRCVQTLTLYCILRQLYIHTSTSIHKARKATNQTTICSRPKTLCNIS